MLNLCQQPSVDPTIVSKRYLNFKSLLNNHFQTWTRFCYHPSAQSPAIDPIPFRIKAEWSPYVALKAPTYCSPLYLWHITFYFPFAHLAIATLVLQTHRGCSPLDPLNWLYPLWEYYCLQNIHITSSSLTLMRSTLATYLKLHFFSHSRSPLSWFSLFYFNHNTYDLLSALKFPTLGPLFEWKLIKAGISIVDASQLPKTVPETHQALNKNLLNKYVNGNIYVRFSTVLFSLLLPLLPCFVLFCFG